MSLLFPRATVKAPMLGFWLFLAMLSLLVGCEAGYRDHPEAQSFIDEMVSTGQFQRQELERLFQQLETQQSVLDAIARPAEKVKPWKDYRKIFITRERIDQGVDFWRNNSDTLAAAAEQYGVPEAVIVAILGVETYYGNRTGGYRVAEALATLAFDYPPRAPFFRKELREFLLLAREQNRDPLQLTGSYAGAMGYGQFMPSSYRAYARDFDGDGFADIWSNPADAIGSIANYLAVHGWQTGQPVAVAITPEPGFDASLLQAQLKPKQTVAALAEGGFPLAAQDRLPDPVRVFELEGDDGAEYWMAATNFYVITRYNHSTLYAMAVWQLAEAITELYCADDCE